MGAKLNLRPDMIGTEVVGPDVIGPKVWATHIVITHSMVLQWVGSQLELIMCLMC